VASECSESGEGLRPPAASARDEKLRKTDRVRKHREYEHAQRAGVRVSCAHVVLLLALREAASLPVRMGIIASRRAGNAVMRNRAKRQVREWFRCRKAALPGAVDLLVILKPNVAELGRGGLARELESALGPIRRRAERLGAKRLP